MYTVSRRDVSDMARSIAKAGHPCRVLSCVARRTVDHDGSQLLFDVMSTDLDPAATSLG